MIIFGIDPGTAIVGYGVIRKRKKTLSHIDSGAIITKSTLKKEDRLKKINNELTKLLSSHKPDIVAVENIFFFKNLKTAMQVSEAKGVILLTAAKKKLRIFEFSPLQVKMAIVGYGRADKKQIQKMIKELLKLEKMPKPDDVADALAVAVCCSYFLDIKKSREA